MRVAAERVAQILGPLWGANVLHNYYLVFIYPAIYLLVTMVLQERSSLFPIVNVYFNL